MMTTWEIVKASFSERTIPGSFGELVAADKAARLFSRLLLANLVVDRDASIAIMNSDPVVKRAIAANPQIKALRDEGVLSD